MNYKIAEECVASSYEERYKNTALFNKINEWMNLKQAAAYLGLTPNALRIRVNRGVIRPSGYIGHSLRFRREDLDKQVESSHLRRIS